MSLRLIPKRAGFQSKGSVTSFSILIVPAQLIQEREKTKTAAGSLNVKEWELEDGTGGRASYAFP